LLDEIRVRAGGGDYGERMAWFKKSSGGDPAQESPGGEHAAPFVPPAIEPLTDDEVVWVRTTIAGLSEQDVRAGDIDDLGRHYDELLTEWLRLREPDRPDPAGVVNQIGLAFGQYVADHTDLEWAVATDQQGPDIALHRPRSDGAVVVYPTDMVSKRWQAEEMHMLPALARTTIDTVSRIP
jgi:hypothetical protein